MDLEKQLLVQDLSFENKKKKKKTPILDFFFEKQTHREEENEFLFLLWLKIFYFHLLKESPFNIQVHIQNKCLFFCHPLGMIPHKSRGCVLHINKPKTKEREH